MNDRTKTPAKAAAIHSGITNQTEKEPMTRNKCKQKTSKQNQKTKSHDNNNNDQ